MNFNLVQRPQRYMGNEHNVIKKSHNNKIKICLSYPGLYEVGMSNLGLHILYGLFNRYSDIVCERVFMPALDFIDILRQKKEKLFSLETKTELDCFDVIGFNFDYELNFTNFLNILSLGGISLKAKNRKDLIVIGGGISNPEPIADFVDVFFLGEFEETADFFLDVLRKYKDKESRLKAFSEKEGFYVPKFYNVSSRNGRYYVEKNYEYAKLPLKRVCVKNLDTSYYPIRWLTPYTQIVHDRIPVEIARGCPNKCAFCQARAVYSPYRERGVNTVCDIIKETYKYSGYENYSLLSLSASNHSKIEEIIDTSIDFCQKNNIGLSLPSLRIDDAIGILYKKLKPLKQNSLTVAVEAARKELRAEMNKAIDTRKLFEAADLMASLKVRRMKLYFMYGFPQETEEDLFAIGELLRKLIRESKISFNLSINIFVPKPFSLWENFSMDEEEKLLEKKRMILMNMPRNRRINTSFTYTKRSMLEAILSRADRRIGDVIYNVYKKGGCFDGEREHFSWQLWEESMKEEGIDYKFYLRGDKENHPWSFIK